MTSSPSSVLTSSHLHYTIENDEKVFHSDVCNHMYHSECILDWLERRSNTECPCCRRPLVSEDAVWQKVKVARKMKHSETKKEKRKSKRWRFASLTSEVNATVNYHEALQQGGNGENNTLISGRQDTVFSTTPPSTIDGSQQNLLQDRNENYHDCGNADSIGQQEQTNLGQGCACPVENPHNKRPNAMPAAPLSTIDDIPNNLTVEGGDEGCQYGSNPIFGGQEQAELDPIVADSLDDSSREGPSPWSTTPLPSADNNLCRDGDDVGCDCRESSTISSPEQRGSNQPQLVPMIAENEVSVGVSYADGGPVSGCSQLGEGIVAAERAEEEKREPSS
jgi:Ring finger domain